MSIEKGDGDLSDGIEPMETADIRSRVVALEHKFAALEQRMIAVENWQRLADIAEARRSEQFKGMDDRFSRIEGDLEKISGTLGRIMWILVGGILSGFVAFVIRGGLAGG